MVTRLLFSLLGALLLSLPHLGQAQTPAVLTWQRAYGTRLNEKEGFSVAVPGGYLLVGEQEQLANTVATLYCVRTNLQGDTLWTKLVDVPGSFNPHITGCVRDAAGNLLVTGLEYTSNLGFVMKLDSDCVPVWTRIRQLTAAGATFNRTSYLMPTVDLDGNYIMVQSHFYTVGQNGDNDDTIMKLNQVSGAEIWVRSLLPFYQNTFNSAGSVRALMKTQNGYTLIVNGTVAPGYQSVIGHVNIGPTGLVVNAGFRTNVTNVHFLASYRDPLGNTLLAGLETLTKYSPQGDTLWHTVVPSRYAGRQWQGAAIGQDAQGNYVVVGNSRLAVSGTVVAENVHMARFRPTTGQLVNDTMLYRPGQTYGRSVALAPNGELVVSGYTLNGTNGGADLFMYQFNGFRPLARRLAVAATTPLQLYPNPARGGATVRVVLPAAVRQGELALTDALGRTVWRQALSTGSLNQNQVPTTGLHTGLYLIRLTSPDGRVWTGKLLCE